MKKYVPLLVVLAVVLIVVGWLFSAYNSFIALGETANTQWAQVESQYQRRADLIPSLVNTVKGFAKQELTVFTEVTNARANASSIQVTPEVLNDPQLFAKWQAAQGQLTGALSRLLVTVEAYPALKSDANFLALQNQLEGTENRIATERMRFNETVRSYNIKAKGIPGKWLVSMFGLDAEKLLFEATEGAEVAPTVDFGTDTPAVKTPAQDAAAEVIVE